MGRPSSTTSSQWSESVGRQSGSGEDNKGGGVDRGDDKKGNNSCAATMKPASSSSFPPRPQLDSRAYAVRKFFTKLMDPEQSGEAVLSRRQEAVKFVSAMVSYEPKNELLYHMADDKQLGGRRVSEIASLATTPLDLRELIFPMLQCFLHPALDAPVCKRSRDRMLTQLYQLPFFIETFSDCLTRREPVCSEGEQELVVRFLSVLALSLMEARSSPAVRNLASHFMMSGETISGMDRLCDILMIKEGAPQLHCRKAAGGPSARPRSYFGASDRAPPGGRHDNDFLNYRDIAIVPTSEEIACPVRPYLPLASKENRFAEIPSNAAYLLDSQFRLLREDFLSPLRQAAAAASAKKLLGGTPIDVHLHRRPCIVFKFDTPTSSNGDIIADLSEFWAKFRGLEFDSLVSLQRNGATVRFGTIAMSAAAAGGVDGQAWLNHPDGPRIGLEFERKEDLFETLNDLCGMEQCEPYELVPASQSFFSYRPVLSCLQKMTSVPLEEEIVDGRTSTNGRPDYIPRMVKLPAECGSVQLDLNAWRDAALTSLLDRSQRDALRLALTNRVAIIQGPPGFQQPYTSY